MTGAIVQLLSVKSRLKRNLVQRDQERKVQNGNVQMTNSTTLSGRPSLPVTRYRLFKVFAAKGSRPELFAGQLRVGARGLPTGRAGFLMKLASAWQRPCSSRISTTPPALYLLDFWRARGDSNS
jgi:hypothetical protein